MSNNYGIMKIKEVLYIEELKSIINVNQSYDFKSENSIYKGDKYYTYNKIKDNLPVGLLRYKRNELLGLKTLNMINSTTQFGLIDILQLFDEETISKLKKKATNSVTWGGIKGFLTNGFYNGGRANLAKKLPSLISKTLIERFDGILDVSGLSEAIENIDVDDLDKFIVSTGIDKVLYNEIDKKIPWAKAVELDPEFIEQSIDIEKVLKEIINIDGFEEVMKETVDIKEEIVENKEMSDAYEIYNIKNRNERVEKILENFLEGIERVEKSEEVGENEGKILEQFLENIENGLKNVNPDYVDILNLCIGGFDLSKLENITTNAELKPLIE